MAKLKGNASKKLKPKQKVKMEKTLEKMQKVRKDDSIHLREIIKDKLEWAKQERTKAIQTINKHQETINDLKAQLLKIEGAILCLNDILNPEPEEK
jgi:hypothetical protein